MTEILAGGVRLVRTQPRAVAIWALLYLVLIVATVALIWPLTNGFGALQQQALAAQAQQVPSTMAADAFAGFFAAILLLDVVMLLAIVMVFAGAVRAVALGGDDRFGFLRLGMDEVRLVGLGILLWLIGMVAAVVVTLVAALLGVLAMLVGGQAGMIVVLLLGYAATFILLLWAEVRISLAGVYTVLRGRIVVREAWRATKGRFWTLFGAYLLLGLAFIAIGVLLVAITNPELFGLYGAMLRGGSPEQLVAYQQQMMVHMFGPRWIVGVVLGTLLNVPLFAILCGAAATAALTLDRRRAGEAES